VVKNSQLENGGSGYAIPKDRLAGQTHMNRPSTVCQSFTSDTEKTDKLIGPKLPSQMGESTHRNLGKFWWDRGSSPSWRGT